MKRNKKKNAVAAFVLVLITILACSAARLWLNKTIPPVTGMTAQLAKLRIEHGNMITQITTAALHFLRLELLVCTIYYLTQAGKIISYQKLFGYFVGGMLAMLAVSVPFGFFDQGFGKNYFWDVFPFLIQMIASLFLFLLIDTYRIIKSKRTKSIQKYVFLKEAGKNLPLFCRHFAGKILPFHFLAPFPNKSTQMHKN